MAVDDASVVSTSGSLADKNVSNVVDASCSLDFLKVSSDCVPHYLGFIVLLEGSC